MNEFFNPTQSSGIKKPETELVEQEKVEYKLIGQYIVSRGLKLFSYNHRENEIQEVVIKYGNTIYLIQKEEGVFVLFDPKADKAVVDSRNIHFEALNLKNAIRRVARFKSGKIKELCNLREPGDGIHFW